MLPNRSGNGGYSISLAKPVADLTPGTTVVRFQRRFRTCCCEKSSFNIRTHEAFLVAQNVKLSGTTPYKGILLFAEVNGRASGSWGALGEGLQVHPSCKHAVTHDVYHLTGHAEDEVPWVVPTTFSSGDTVVFKATVVRSYSTWCEIRPNRLWLPVQTFLPESYERCRPTSPRATASAHSIVVP